jgi:phasin family protein
MAQIQQPVVLEDEPMPTPTPDVNVQELLAPAKALNELAMSTVERVVDLQLQVAARLSSAMLATSKEALEVQDVAGAQAYFEKRREVAAQVGQDLAKDAQTIVELGKEYAEGAGKVMTANVSKFTKAAA